MCIWLCLKPANKKHSFLFTSYKAVLVELHKKSEYFRQNHILILSSQQHDYIGIFSVTMIPSRRVKIFIITDLSETWINNFSFCGIYDPWVNNQVLLRFNINRNLYIVIYQYSASYVEKMMPVTRELFHSKYCEWCKRWTK